MNENVKLLGKYAGIFGIFTIIAGSVAAIAGLFLFIVGAIPGVIQIVLGAKLLKVKKYAKEFNSLGLDNSSDQINNIMMLLGTYFEVQVVCVVVGLIFYLIFAILG